MAFPNILFGTDGDQFVTSTTAATSLNSPQVGDALRIQDGRIFRWSQAGAVAVVVGKLYQAAIPVADHVLQTASAAAVGATSISLALGATAITGNQYLNGWVTVDLVGNSGFGYAYGIGQHGPVAASGTFVIPIKTTVQVAIATTANSVSLVPNNHQGIILAVATNPTAAIAGVSVKPIPIGNYGYVCTAGTCMCLTVTPVGAIATQVIPATTTGAVMAQSTATSLTLPILGTVLRTAVTASYLTMQLYGVEN
jgi:hypothetical protein